MKIVIGFLTLLISIAGLACGGADVPGFTPVSPTATPSATPGPIADPPDTPTGPPATDPAPGTPTAPPATETPTPAPQPIPDLVAFPAFPNLSFDDLTNLVQPPAEPRRLYVTERDGRIFAFEPRPDVAEADLFLDIRRQVSTASREEGLLGLAFHPQYAENGRFFVYYSVSNPRQSIVSQFSTDPANPHLADPASEVVLMEIPQPFPNHNGGAIDFGPDGYLYIGLGDGGSGGDPQGHGQNAATLLGTILRIDVDSPEDDLAYGFPPDNPFVEHPAVPDEIWAYGLRNPWRFSFDPATGDFWVADVGQDRWEEINIVERGRNYGWNIMEGEECFPPSTQCDTTGLELPIHVYSIAGTGHCAVIGGPVYRGDLMPQLDGVYVFGDFCSGTVWGLRYDGTEVTEHRVMVETGVEITSFGVDRDGNLYLVTFRGEIYRLTTPDFQGRFSG
jgi:glucose/arabinose dehydrogenase